VLSAVQEAKEKTETVIEAAKALKSALLKYLFTYGPVPVDEADSVELKDTLVGPMPRGWELQRLGDISELRYGYTATARRERVGPKFLRVTDIGNDGAILWESVPYCEIDSARLPRFSLRLGDVVVARIGATTGKAAIIRTPVRAVFASYLIRVRVTSTSVRPEYLFAFVTTERYWEQIRARRGGKLKQGVSASALADLLVPVPPMEAQRQLAAIMAALDDKIAAERQRSRALDELFRTLLRDLMTGRIRVNDLDLEVGA